MAIKSGNNQPADPHIDSDALGPYTSKRAYRVVLTDTSGNPYTAGGGGGGTVTANQGTAGGTAWPVSVSNFPATQTISGSVSVSNFPATQSISGTVTANAGSGTFTVGGSVSVSNFPATQAVSGTVAATQSGTWTVAVSTTGFLSLGVYNSTQPTLSSGGSAPLQVDPSGNLRIVSQGGIVGASQSGNWTVTSQGLYTNSLTTVTNNTSSPYYMDKRSNIKISETGSDDPLVGITPVVTQAGTSAVGKNSQGNLYSAYAVNSTTTAGYLVLINAAAAPTSGAAITPIDVATLGGTIGASAQINYGAGPPNAYSTGIVALVTTSLTTYTPGGNAFIHVRVR